MYRFYSVTTLPQVHEWQAVVALAKQSDVIFNGIDMGALFDAALNGLSLELGIPLVRIYVYMSVYLSVYVCYCIYKMTPTRYRLFHFGIDHVNTPSPFVSSSYFIGVRGTTILHLQVQGQSFAWTAW